MDAPEAIPAPSKPNARPGRGCLIVLLAGALALGIVSTLRSRAARQLTDVQSRLDQSDPGWRLAALLAARPEVDDAENAALVIDTVLENWPPCWPDWRRYVTETTGETSSLDLESSFLQLNPPVQLQPLQFRALRGELSRISAAHRDAARSLATLKRGRFARQFRAEGTPTEDAHVGKLHRVRQLLEKGAWLSMQEGDLPRATEACRAILIAARTVAADPLPSAQRDHDDTCTAGVFLVVRLLSQGQVAQAELAVLQAVLDEEAQREALLIACRGARASLDAVLSAAAAGNVSVIHLLHQVYAPPVAQPHESEVVPDLLGIFLRTGRLEDYHRTALEQFNEAVRLVQLPPTERSLALARWRQTYRRSPAVTQWSCLQMDQVLDRALRTQVLVSCARVLVAVERYRLANQHWPGVLQDLTPNYLTEVPTDPFDGQPLRYRIVADGVVVYAVNVDGKDDGGNLTGKDPLGAPDLGVRLWNTEHRRQPPQPLPTTTP